MPTLRFFGQLFSSSAIVTHERREASVHGPASDSINLSSAMPNHKGKGRRAVVWIYRRHPGKWRM